MTACCGRQKNTEQTSILTVSNALMQASAVGLPCNIRGERSTAVFAVVLDDIDKKALKTTRSTCPIFFDAYRKCAWSLLTRNQAINWKSTDSGLRVDRMFEWDSRECDDFPAERLVRGHHGNTVYLRTRCPHEPDCDEVLVAPSPDAAPLPIEWSPAPKEPEFAALRDWCQKLSDMYERVHETRFVSSSLSTRFANSQNIEEIRVADITLKTFQKSAKKLNDLFHN